MLALTTEHDSAMPAVVKKTVASNSEPKTIAQTTVAKKQPIQTTVPKAPDEVKIISFGAPKSTSFNTQQANQTINPNYKSTVRNSGSNVVFYEATKDEGVFAGNNAQNNAQNNDDIEFKNYRTSNQTQLPMLNPKVSTLKVPFHIIEFGENLFSISVRYNVKLQKLLQWNGLKESDRVMNGSKIYLNDPNIYYEIKAGDTLYEIATQRHVLIDELMRWNKLSPDIALTPGHRLLLVDPESYIL